MPSTTLPSGSTDSTLRGALRCLDHVFFHNREHPAFPYSRTGTGFYLVWNNRVYFITTTHCLPPDRLIHDLAIGLDDSCNSTFRVTRFTCFNGSRNEKPAWQDIAAISIAETEHEVQSRRRLNPVTLLGPESNFDPGKADFLVFAGLPTELNAPDYDKRLLSDVPAMLQAKHVNVGRCDYLEAMEVTVQHQLTDFDGLSGGPVFAVWKNYYYVAGMIVCGSVESGLVHFIPMTVIAELLKTIESNSPMTAPASIQFPN